MIAKKIIKDRIHNVSNPVKVRDFLDIHIALEGYLKHIFLIGLRLQGCTYAESVSAIKSHFIRLNSHSFKAALRLMKSRKSWHQIKSSNTALKDLEKLCYDYSSKVRNLIVHGNYYKLEKEKNELQLLYEIDRTFILSLEKAMEKIFNGNSILNNSPKDFGAVKGTIKDIDRIGRILNQQVGLKPIKFEEAEQKFQTIKQQLSAR